MAPKWQMPSSAGRSGTFVTPSLTCHIVWHPLYFTLRLPLRSPPHPPTPPQAGLTGPMPPLRLSPATPLPNRLSPPPPVRTLMSSMVAPANSIKVLLQMPLPVGAKAKERNLLLVPLPSKVASVIEAASPKGPPPLTSAARRFYAPRNLPAPHPEHDLIRIRWPDLASSLLREANSGLPVSFKVFVNDNGAVSLTVIDTSVPAASYSPFFDPLTHKLNQSFPVGDNPWMPLATCPY